MPPELLNAILERGVVNGRYTADRARSWLKPSDEDPTTKALVLGKLDPKTKEHTPGSVDDVVWTELDFPCESIILLSRRTTHETYRGISPDNLFNVLYDNSDLTPMISLDPESPGNYEVNFFSNRQLAPPPKLKLLKPGQEEKTQETRDRIFIYTAFGEVLPAQTPPLKLVESPDYDGSTSAQPSIGYLKLVK